MESNTVQQLRKIAKERGLKGYSRLKKADLVKLLEQPTPHGIVNFIDEEEVPPPRERHQPSPPPLRKPSISQPFQMKSKQTRRQKREEKNFEAPSPVELVDAKTKEKTDQKNQEKTPKGEQKVKK